MTTTSAAPDALGSGGRGHRSDDSNVRFASIDRVRFACDVCKQTREYATIPINRFSEEYQNLANLLIEEVFGEEPPERIDPGEIVYNILDVIATRKRIPL